MVVAMKGSNPSMGMCSAEPYVKDFELCATIALTIRSWMISE